MTRELKLLPRSLPYRPSTPIALEPHDHFAQGGSADDGVRLVEALERNALAVTAHKSREKNSSARGTRLSPDWGPSLSDLASAMERGLSRPYIDAACRARTSIRKPRNSEIIGSRKAVATHVSAIGPPAGETGLSIQRKGTIMDALTTVEEVFKPIPLPDVRCLDPMRSLPAWLALRIELMTEESEKSPAGGRYHRVSKLPASLMLSHAQRAELERCVAEIEALCAQTLAKAAEWESVIHIAVTEMMLVLPSSQHNDLAVDATWRAFREALEGVPHWAVEAALRRWYRGDCGLNERSQQYDYRWRPAPTELRSISLREMYRFKDLARSLRRLLAAELLVEFSAEHRERMSARLHDLSITLRGVA